MIFTYLDQTVELDIESEIFTWKNVQTIKLREIKIKIHLSKIKGWNYIRLNVAESGCCNFWLCKVVTVDGETYYSQKGRHEDYDYDRWYKRNGDLNSHLIPNTPKNLTYLRELKKEFTKRLNLSLKAQKDNFNKLLKVNHKLYEIIQRDL